MYQAIATLLSQVPDTVSGVPPQSMQMFKKCAFKTGLVSLFANLSAVRDLSIRHCSDVYPTMTTVATLITTLVADHTMDYAATRIQAVYRRYKYFTDGVMEANLDATSRRLNRILKLEAPTPDDLIWDDMRRAHLYLEKGRISDKQFARIIRKQCHFLNNSMGVKKQTVEQAVWDALEKCGHALAIQHKLNAGSAVRAAL
jgi:hypothetical protein